MKRRFPSTCCTGETRAAPGTSARSSSSTATKISRAAVS